MLYQIDGRQSALTLNDPRQAEAMVALIKAHGCERALEMHGIESAPRRHDAAPPWTVGGWIDCHIDALSGVERKTIAEYRRYLTRDIDPALGHVPLAALSRTDISKWVNKLRAGGASGKTIQNKMGFLSGCLNAAVGDGHLPANPADVDRGNNTTRINKAWKRVPDGGEGRYELGQPKTRRSVRSVSIPASVLDGLDDRHYWLFTNSQGGPIRLYSQRTNVWVPSLAKARTKDPNHPDKAILTKPVRIHDLRHTAASWLLVAAFR